MVSNVVVLFLIIDTKIKQTMRIKKRICIFALRNIFIMKKRITKDDYIKANRKASRDAEIKEHGHPVCYKRVHESKKVYNRKKIRAVDNNLPYFFDLFK